MGFVGKSKFRYDHVHEAGSATSRCTCMFFRQVNTDLLHPLHLHLIILYASSPAIFFSITETFVNLFVINHVKGLVKILHIQYFIIHS